MRAPNRWSVGVSLGVLIVAFCWIAHAVRIRQKKAKWIELGVTAALLSICVAEFPPTFAFPTREIEPKLDFQKNCGRGVFLPYWSADDPRSYHSALRLRGTDCEVINMQNHPPTDRSLTKILGSDLMASNAGPTWKNAAQVLSSSSVSWIIYDTGLLPKDTCSRLGFSEQSSGLCKLGATSQKNP